MSYPLSAVAQPRAELFDPPLAKPEDKNFYMVAYMVFGPDEKTREEKDCAKVRNDWTLGSFCINRHTAKDAETSVMNWLKWVYKECDGYVKYRVKADPISEIQLNNAGYFRR